MSPDPHITLPVPEPLALIDATLLFLIQVLIAQHPDLLAPPEEPVLRPPYALRAARLLYDSVRQLHELLDIYRSCLPSAPGIAEPAANDYDDIPF